MHITHEPWPVRARGGRGRPRGARWWRAVRTDAPIRRSRLRGLLPGGAGIVWQLHALTAALIMVIGALHAKGQALRGRASANTALGQALRGQARANAELQRVNAALEQRVAAATADLRRTQTILSGSACCVYGLTFTSHFYGARRSVGYVPFNSESLVTGKLF